MLRRGYRATLYEARETKSKYVTVYHGDLSFKVRFSDHAPNRKRELRGDCDFFVGKNHTSWTNTQQAIAATLRHLAGRKRPEAT